MDISALRNYSLPPEIVEILQQRGIVALNRIQSEAISEGLLEGGSLLVSAPTSAGKTLIGELVALSQAASGLTAYLVSHKALAREVTSLFQRSYHSATPLLRVGMLTGDIDTVHGEWRAFDLIVSTYEKFYASLSAFPQLLSRLRAVVIDELQTVGELSRGPGLELLISRLRLQQKKQNIQIVGLSATIPNAKHLSDWLESGLIFSNTRTPPLDYEIWMPGRRWTFRQDEENPRELANVSSRSSLPIAIRDLFGQDREPVVIMAMTRPASLEHAEEVAKSLASDQDFPIEIVNEFRAVGDNSTLTEQVCALLHKGVGVHNADLTPEQLAVIENAVKDGTIRVLSATPTLVAGVNLPIRTVIYPSLMRWQGEEEQYIELREFLNGAGRAGRAGYCDRGTCIVFADTLPQAREIAQRYINQEPEDVHSQLENRSKAYHLLHLLAGLRESTSQGLAEAASLTLWGFEQGLIHNERQLAALAETYSAITQNETLGECWETEGEEIRITRIGQAVSGTGLEPTLAIEIADLLERFRSEMESTSEDVAIRRLLLRLCHNSGADDFLPYPGRAKREWAYAIRSTTYSGVSPLNDQSLVGYGHALIAIGDNALPHEIWKRMSSGFRGERTRICDQLSRLIVAGTRVLEERNPSGYEATTYRLQILASQLEFQMVKEAVPFARLFREHRVPNVGFARVTKLASLCGGEISVIPKLSDEQLGGAVGKAQVQGVKEVALDYLGGLTKEQSKRQLGEARKSEYRSLVEDLLGKSGRIVEMPIKDVLALLGWNVEKIPEQEKGKKADFAGEAADGTEVLIECKAAEDFGGEVSEKEALDVLRKYPEGYDGYVITIGRPIFSPAAVEKAMRKKGERPRFRLITVGALVELLLSQIRGVSSANVLEELIAGFTHIDVARVRQAIQE